MGGHGHILRARNSATSAFHESPVLNYQLTISAVSCGIVTCWNCFGIHFGCSLQGQHGCTCAIMFPTAQRTAKSRTDNTCCHLRNFKSNTTTGSPTDKWLNIANRSSDVTSFSIKYFSRVLRAANKLSLRSRNHIYCTRILLLYETGRSDCNAAEDSSVMDLRLIDW